MDELAERVGAAIRFADAGSSRLAPSVLTLEGMSSPKVRHLLNRLCDRPGARYLEVGVLSGSTLVSALSGNPFARAFGVENWSEFGGSPARLSASLQLLSEEERSRLTL